MRRQGLDDAGVGLGIGMVGLDIVTALHLRLRPDARWSRLCQLRSACSASRACSPMSKDMRVGPEQVGRDMLPTRDEWHTQPHACGTRRSRLLHGHHSGLRADHVLDGIYAIEQGLEAQGKSSQRRHQGIADPVGEQRCNQRRHGAILALGVPGSPATAVLFGAMLMQGLRPADVQEQPRRDLGLPGVVYVGNVILVLLNTLFIPFFTKMTVKAVPIINAIVLASASSACSRSATRCSMSA